MRNITSKLETLYHLKFSHFCDLIEANVGRNAQQSKVVIESTEIQYQPFSNIFYMLSKDMLKPIPNGFRVIKSLQSETIITCRTTETGCLRIFLVLWLCLWTYICINFTISALGGNYFSIFFAIAFWWSEFHIIKYIAWYFFSAKFFTFCPDYLRVENKLFRYSRQRTIFKNEIECVRQTKDRESGMQDSCDWGLMIEGKSKFKVLSKRTVKETKWLGPIIANWAAAKYEPYRNDENQYEEI